MGLGTAFGHAGIVARTLSKANLEMFLPRGLEIWFVYHGVSDINLLTTVINSSVMTTQCLNSTFGVSSSRALPSQPMAGAPPEARLAAYRGILAPVSMVLPPAARGGRNDPIAMLGRGMASRDAQKKVQKAAEDAQEGKLSAKDGAAVEVKWVSHLLVYRQARSRC